MNPTHAATIGAREVRCHLDTPNGVFQVDDVMPLCSGCQALDYHVRRQVDHAWALVCRACGMAYTLKPIE